MCDVHTQELPAVFVRDGKPFQPSPVDGLIVDEIIAPNLIDCLAAVVLAGAARVAPATFLAGFAGTLSPSRFQIRCTRLGLTSQPSRRNSLVTVR